MSLEKISVVDKIEVTQDGVVQVRTKFAVMENGQQISSSFHRRTIYPGQDYSQEQDCVQAICAAIHTTALVKGANSSSEQGV